ncbi:tRNA uridine-5-carboxymethylaminomethyl(34) synthesis GTPase MnmE [Nitrosomonas sp. Is37]|uniref:tRNA uridine-5-carboxymethylaminomethyl(34) synthesis GTPase MnmE n=1 Tax=Nitrosomonas sp. Is37 TaxID=3080535 RepID=UPI00294B2223|nr:tRNA uridine-5-carboxymethylaminomethyl(34) synthesis GTPase MnmE [Nitrosomonas sp. Is37]MDV6344862.1 tRNA uridine-5-carboxymethylaminomethyl(34) synthesis GTPase MnmE [Nitrosomonas sp. Is37]
MHSNDIIAAIATPPGRGGIGVIRVSGKNLHSIAKAILGLIPHPRHAHLSHFLDENGHSIDQGIAIYYPSPHSYTGEDVFELQGHGGPAVINLLLSRCLQLGARLAEPGEFTLRAFLNNKLDLVQAESVADLIDASTAGAARCAMRSLQGEFSATIQALVQALIDLRMLVEATLDFPEEEIDFLESAHAATQLHTIREKLECVLLSSRQGSLLQEGVKVVLVGQPNVGKSSLMNRLSGDEVAIVTEIPGTTRDTIQQLIQIEGIPVHIIDTAGLRETTDIVEKSGIARTHAVIKKADLALLLIDSRYGLTDADQKILRSLPADLPLLTVFNKIDLLSESARIEEKSGRPIIYLSAKTGIGLELLRMKMLEMIGWQSNIAGEGMFMARQRHLQALSKARTHLNNATPWVESGRQLELLAEELRLAQLALSSITGEFTADDLLGEIFSRFCIGK